MKWTKRCANSRHGSSDSSSSISTPSILPPSRMIAGRAAGMWKRKLTFTRNPALRGGSNDSKESSGPGFAPVLNRNHRRNHKRRANRTEAVEEENPGRSHACPDRPPARGRGEKGRRTQAGETPDAETRGSAKGPRINL